MKKAFYLMIVFCCSGAFSSAWAGELAGTLTHTSGPITVRKADGTIKSLAINASVETGDLITTEKRTYARIRFRDNSEVILKPNTEFKVEQFGFKKDQPSEDKAVYNLIKGGLRTVSGQIGKRGDPDSYRMKTPTATIGIRGTTYTVDYIPPENQVAPLPPLVSLMAEQNAILKGKQTTLTWTSRNATSCDLQPGIGPIATIGSLQVTPENDTLYTVTCKGEGDDSSAMASAVASIAITLITPPAAERFCNKPAVLNIHFDTGKSTIKKMYEEDLNLLGRFLQEFPKAKGEISGHTDSVGSKTYNQKLSQRRADSVKNYIGANFKIAPERISTKGYGMSKPVADNATKEGKAKNRRIEANFVCE